MRPHIGVFIKFSLAVNCFDFHGSPLSDKSKRKIRIGKTICALYTISTKGLTPFPLFLLSRGCEPLHVTALCCFCVGTALSTHVTLRSYASPCQLTLCDLYAKPERVKKKEAPPTNQACDHTLKLFHDRVCGW